VQPRLVTAIRRPDGRVEHPAAPPPVRVISEETARSLRSILAGVVERGTGSTAAIPGFSVAGKTGTAQKAGPGGYQAGRYVPNFVGFVPADNPRVVAVVVVEEPRGKYYSRDVAAPLFARVVTQALDILRVAPAAQQLPATVLAASGGRVAYPDGVVPVSVRGTRPGLSGSSPAAATGVELSEEALPKIQAPEGPAPGESQGVPTPDVVGLSARQALAIFARLGMTAHLRGSGFVVSQDPLPGTASRPGDSHTLRLLETAPPISRPGRGREETSSPVPGP
jgi:stage V sporulation protein D (sporulation-specific penicillin-binding protein)